MAELQPTDQAARDRIHHDLDATLFVEAGAGTGKTRELIERIVRLVVSGRTELRHIAAITFTESAAAELRDRLRVRLEEAGRDEAGLSPDERARCAGALAEIDAAAIETLHAFAQRILAAHPLEAGLPPIIEIQDDTKASIAFDERWAAFVDELLSNDELEEALLRAFTLGLQLPGLRSVAQEFHQHWDRLENAAIAVAPLPPLDVSSLLDQLSSVCNLRRHCRDHADGLFEHLERVDRYCQRLASAQDDLDRLRILAERAPIRTNYGQASNWRSFTPSEIRSQLAAAHEGRAALVEGVRRALLPALLSAVRTFILGYADERRRQGRLEFHDLLVQARGLLRRDAAVRRRLREQFSHLLIDEFQDTDPLQIEIASLIAGRETDGAPPPWHEAEIEAGRLFFVGDPKQSVYRFRRADIVLYQRAQGRFASDTVYLTQNFRSVPAVIAWVNHLFGGLMAVDHDAGQAPYVPLEAWWPAGELPSVRALVGTSKEPLPAIREREAGEIVRLIQAAKAEGWPVTEVGLDGERRRRAAMYADIAILMPTRTTLPPIEDALEAAGVPYRVESRSLVYDTQEVRDLLSVLRALDDPTDQVALIAALRSPALACSDDDLLRFAQAGGRWDYRPDAPAALPEDDSVGEAMRALRELHDRRWWDTISGLVEAVIRKRRLFELGFAHRRPRGRWQRLRFLLDQARAFEEAGGRTLRQFIDWAERQAVEGTRVVETVVPEPDDDAVRIMTIHAAKGLEFPIVILAGLNLEAKQQGQRKREVLWDEHGQPQVQLGSFKTPGYDALSQHEAVMDAQEKVRLLYVAATRARDHLVASLHHKEDSDCQARRVLEGCMQSTNLWQAVDAKALPAPGADSPSTAPFEDSPQRRSAWLEARSERLERLSRAPWRSATEIAQHAAGAGDDPNLRKEAPVEELPPWRRGRAGTALGRAVHAVLQSIDLATGADVDGAARAQAAAEGIADRAGEVARMVRSALHAATVREAVGRERYWRELYVAAPVGGALLEGFVDLLYEGPEGLVVVDYKTDAVPGERELTAAMARYRLQGAAYALAVQEALGRPVARCVFVFAQARGAQQREIEDLPAAIADVREELRRVEASSTAG